MMSVRGETLPARPHDVMDRLMFLDFLTSFWTFVPVRAILGVVTAACGTW